MKTIVIKFPVSKAEIVGILLNSLELKTLTTWCDDDWDSTIFCVLKLASDSATIPAELQIEKIREKTFIKIVKQ